MARDDGIDASRFDVVIDCARLARVGVAGIVLGTDCKPIDRALLDFWQADASGVYDNRGYRLRGHQRMSASLAR